MRPLAASVVLEFGGDAVAYTARITFTPDASVRYGMSVTVSTLD